MAVYKYFCLSSVSLQLVVRCVEARLGDFMYIHTNTRAGECVCVCVYAHSFEAKLFHGQNLILSTVLYQEAHNTWHFHF